MDPAGLARHLRPSGMKLPRWLSPVRTVHAETGWPRPVCKTVAQTIYRGHDWRRPVAMLATTPLVLVIASPSFFLIAAEPPRLTRRYLALDYAWDALCVVVFSTSVVAPLIIVACAFEAGMARRFLRRYLPAPWCFKCKYPIPPPREGRSYSICPECGEPIPPEIARLVARGATETDAS